MSCYPILYKSVLFLNLGKSALTDILYLNRKYFKSIMLYRGYIPTL
nr:MAG TPA: hypothetical protein [Caudoviricetes sp.]